MRHIIIIFSILSSGVLCCQDTWFDIRNSNAKPITQATLIRAQTLKDINPGYPSSWIADSDYISTNISIESSGDIKSSEGFNEQITTEQKTLLQKADIGTDIRVTVSYMSGSMTKEMNFSMTVSPTQEASYSGGKEALLDYINENAISHIAAHQLLDKNGVEISFEINKDGQAVIKELRRSSSDKATDQLLLQVIEQMPRWSPALDSDGNPVKQQFTFVVGGENC